jgi:hypothetical protein
LPTTILPASKLLDLNQSFDLFDAAYEAHITAEAAAQAARVDKTQTRDSDETLVRGIVKALQANPDLSDPQREALGITVAKPKSPTGKPTSRPNAEVENLAALTQVWRLNDSETGKRSKPDGVVAAEIRLKVVAQGEAAPTDVEQMEFAGVTTTTKVVREFDGADVGKTAYWAFRWISPRGEAGPWSAITSATIAA